MSFYKLLSHRNFNVCTYYSFVMYTYGSVSAGPILGVLHGTSKFFLRPNKSVSRVFKTQLAKINWTIKSISSGLVTRRLYFLKKYDTKWPKFPPCRNWPIWELRIEKQCEILRLLTHLSLFLSAGIGWRNPTPSSLAETVRDLSVKLWGIWVWNCKLFEFEIVSSLSVKNVNMLLPSHNRRVEELLRHPRRQTKLLLNDWG